MIIAEEFSAWGGLQETACLLRVKEATLTP
jgi:hypothetical protein